MEESNKPSKLLKILRDYFSRLSVKTSELEEENDRLKNQMKSPGIVCDKHPNLTLSPDYVLYGHKHSVRCEICTMLEENERLKKEIDSLEDRSHGWEKHADVLNKENHEMRSTIDAFRNRIKKAVDNPIPDKFEENKSRHTAVGIVQFYFRKAWEKAGLPWNDVEPNNSECEEMIDEIIRAALIEFEKRKV